MSFNQRDFIRQLPGVQAGFRRKYSFWGRLHVDPLLALLLLILAGIGLVVLYSASDQDIGMVERQLARLAAGFVVMLVFAQISPHHYQRWAPWLMVAGIIMLAAVLVVGVGAKGAQRWLEIPGLPRFQPSEIIKIALPMALAAYYARCSLPPRLRHIFWGLVIIAVPTLLIAEQPDLGTALLIGAAGTFVLLFSGIRWRLIGGFGLLISACGPLLWMYMKDYQKKRVLTFLDPESDPLGAGWNIIQSKTAIGSGGWYGKGWLGGTQSHLDFLPESHTDFIIAVFAEEFGFVGVVLLLCFYLLIVSRCLYIAAMADDTFGRLLAGSLALTFFFYVFVNIGMVSGLLPVVGLPLPLISYGGTSVVTLFIGFGLLMSIQTHRKLLSR